MTIANRYADQLKEANNPPAFYLNRDGELHLAPAAYIIEGGGLKVDKAILSEEVPKFLEWLQKTFVEET